MGILLLLLSILLFWVAIPLGVLFLIHKWVSSGKPFKVINRHAYLIAVSIDQLGNVVFKDMFNTILIKKEGYSFGNPDETISGVLGKNKVTKTLSLYGKMLAFILNKIDPNHVENSIDEL